jgi:hypothetical protein
MMTTSKMGKKESEFIKFWLKEKNLKLEYLHEKHQIDIAVYNAKREMLMSDIDSLEKQLGGYEDVKN